MTTINIGDQMIEQRKKMEALITEGHSSSAVFKTMVEKPLEELIHEVYTKANLISCGDPDMLEEIMQNLFQSLMYSHFVTQTKKRFYKPKHLRSEMNDFLKAVAAMCQKQEEDMLKEINKCD